MKKILIVLLFVNVLGCDRIEYEEPILQPFVVGFISADSVSPFIIGSTKLTFSDFVGKIDVGDIKIGDLDSDVSHRFIRNDTNPSLYSVDKNFAPVKGGKYRIQIQTSNSLVSAIDSIPEYSPSFKLLSTSVNVDQATKNELNIDRTCIIQINNNQAKGKCYYELIVYAIEQNPFLGTKGMKLRRNITTSTEFITTEDYYPSSSAVDFNPPSTLLFMYPDNAPRVLIDFSYRVSVFSRKGKNVSSAHELTVEVREISFAYYKYKTSFYKQKATIEGDEIFGGATPVNVFSNVANGTGIFAAYTASMESKFIEEYEYQPN